jgi:tRNA(Ile)-lysidine synthase
MAPRKMPEAGSPGTHARLADLVQDCPELQQASRIVVGFSGGVDSTVLLHLLHAAQSQDSLKASVGALHINHQMQADADRWEDQCRLTCEGLSLSFASVRIPVVPVIGESLEETARDARHAAFAVALKPGDVLALAQHRDDQVETVLFRLLRGSGAAGLAGMPGSRPCGEGLLVRPLLGASRAELLSFATANGLAWIEDGSNTNQRFDRNFLRHSVLPLLHERWPGLAPAVQRSARLSGEAAELIDALAMLDLAAAVGPGPEQLNIAAVLSLSAPRQRNVFRYWLQTVCTGRGWAAPTHHVLERIMPEVIAAHPDAEPLLSWGEGSAAVELRRHRGVLHVLAPLPPAPEPLTWSTGKDCALPAPLGALALQAAEGRGLPRDRLREVRVCFRSGGELVKAAGRPTRPLKKILQDAGIPPWLRERIPLLYVGNELVAVADLLVCEGWLADASENRCRVAWRHPDLDCGYPPHLLI